VIGIVAKYADINNIKVDIVTTDKDLLQLVTNNVKVHLSIKGVSIMDEYTMENFSEKFNGLTPSQIIDFKALAGDSSDNIEGIRGIGDKGAIKLLLEYKTFENIVSNVNNLTLGLKTKIMDNLETGRLSYSLATIITETDIEINFENMMIKTPDQAALIDFLDER
jgi:DNA polymerase-1